MPGLVLWSRNQGVDIERDVCLVLMLAAEIDECDAEAPHVDQEFDDG